MKPLDYAKVYSSEYSVFDYCSNEHFNTVGNFDGGQSQLFWTRVSSADSGMGSMLQEVKCSGWLHTMMIFPGLALMLVVVGFNTLGDGLRVALDPRMKNR
jgi:hypothetical protein